MAASGLMENGPKLEWSRDNKQYEHFQTWQKRCKMVFKAALKNIDGASKCEYLKYWMGTEGIPLIDKWENSGKLVYVNPPGTAEGEIPSGHNLDTYWNLLEEEFKPKENKIILILDLWTKLKQNSTSLNEWIMKVYNIVELCNYPADRDSIKNRIIRDVLIVGCTNSHAKDKIIRKGSEATLNDVIEILQLEESASRTLQTIDPEVRSIHYARYDKRKGNPKNDKSRSSTIKNEYSSSRSSDCTESTSLCYRCHKPFTRGHLKNCKAIDVECNYCRLKGHFEKCCKKAGNFPMNENSKLMKQ